MIERFGARAIAAAVFAVFLFGLILFGVSQCQQRQRASKQAEVNGEQGQASVRAGADAINTVGNVATNDAATDASVANGQVAIRNAPEGQKGKAARAAACSMKTYRDTPDCKGK